MDQSALWSTYKVPIILGGISLLLVVYSITLLVKSIQTSRPIEFSTDLHEATVAGSMTPIMVDVAGAVQRPGVYKLAPNARVEEALVASGGLSINADTEWVAKNINRAMKLTDGLKIYIPTQGESKTISATTVAQGGNISINAASQSELEGLPGVGPVTAQKIIDNRPYTSIDQLISKKAMGQSLFDKIKNQLTL